MRWVKIRSLPILVLHTDVLIHLTDWTEFLAQIISYSELHPTQRCHSRILYLFPIDYSVNRETVQRLRKLLSVFVAQALWRRSLLFWWSMFQHWSSENDYLFHYVAAHNTNPNSNPIDPWLNTHGPDSSETEWKTWNDFPLIFRERSHLLN